MSNSFAQIGVQAIVAGAAQASADADLFNAAMTRMVASATNAATGFGGLNAGLAGITASLGPIGTVATAVGIALVGLGSTAVTIAAQYQQSMRLVQDATSATVAQMEQLNVVNQQVAVSYGESINAIGNVDVQLARSGQNIQTMISGQVDAIATLSRATGLTLPQATQATIEAYNAFKSQGVSVAEVVNGLAIVMNNTGMSAQATAQYFATAGSQAALAGISFKDFSAMVELVGQTGTATGRSYNDLSLILSQLINPSKQAKQLMDEYNLSLAQYIQDGRGAIQFIDDLNATLGEGAVATGHLTQAEADKDAQILTGNRGIQDAAAFLGDLATNADKARKSLDDNSYASKQSKENLDSLNGQVDVAKAKFGDAATFLGGPFAKALQTIAEGFNADTDALGGFIDKLSGFNYGNILNKVEGINPNNINAADMPPPDGMGVGADQGPYFKPVDPAIIDAVAKGVEGAISRAEGPSALQGEHNVSAQPPMKLEGLSGFGATDAVNAAIKQQSSANAQSDLNALVTSTKGALTSVNNDMATYQANIIKTNETATDAMAKAAADMNLQIQQETASASTAVQRANDAFAISEQRRQETSSLDSTLAAQQLSLDHTIAQQQMTHNLANELANLQKTGNFGPTYDAAQAKQEALDLASAQTDQQRTAIQNAYTMDKQAETQRQADAQTTLDADKAQQQADLAFSEQVQAERTAQQDSANAQRLALNEKYAQEDLDNQIKNINAERDARIQATKDAEAQKEKDIKDAQDKALADNAANLNKQVTDVQSSLDQQITDINTAHDKSLAISQDLYTKLTAQLGAADAVALKTAADVLKALTTPTPTKPTTSGSGSTQPTQTNNTSSTSSTVNNSSSSQTNLTVSPVYNNGQQSESASDLAAQLLLASAH